MANAFDGLLLKTYIKKKQVAVGELASAMAITRQALNKLYKTREFKEDTKQRIAAALGTSWALIEKTTVVDPYDNRIDSSVVEDRPADYMYNSAKTERDILLKAIEDLAYAARTNADTMASTEARMKWLTESDRMKTTTIATLVNSLGLNSEVSHTTIPTPSPEDLRTGNVPAEWLLTPEGQAYLNSRTGKGQKAKLGT